MKKLINIMILLAILSVFSCTKVIYTNEQVLDRYKTKQEIAKKFGAPLEVVKSDTTEEWLYQYDRLSPYKHHSLIENPDRSTKNVEAFDKYKRYVVFYFDKQGKLTKWKCEGVNFSEKKPDTLGTVILVGIGVGVIVLSVIAANNFSIGSVGYL